MKKRFLAVACAAVLAIGCIAGLAGCGSSSNKQVAATVNGTSIYEETITADVEAFRANYDLSDEESWAEWMTTYGYTPETVRTAMIDSYVEKELVKQAAKENGVTVDTATVDEHINSIKSNYSSDDAWKSALEQAGYTEDSYREAVEDALLEQDLMDKVTPLADPDADTLLTYAKMYSSYYDGAKKSSHILFSSSDTSTAQSVLDQINAGTLTFADAAKQYSKDDDTKADGGNMGWDILSSYSDAYTTALDGLTAGQVSALVTDTDGIHIIQCTEVYTAPTELTSVDQMPSELLDSIKEMVASYDQQTNFEDWLSEYKDKADIQIKDMPSGLSYYVDMSKYESSNTSDNTTTTTNSSTTTDNTTANVEDGDKE